MYCNISDVANVLFCFVFNVLVRVFTLMPFQFVLGKA